MHDMYNVCELQPILNPSNIFTCKKPAQIYIDRIDFGMYTNKRESLGLELQIK